MSASTPRRLLVVANRTAATPTLLDTVRTKAAEGTTKVTLLVPAFPTVFDPEALESRHTIELAIPLLPTRVSRWLKRDLPQRVERLGVPVTVVTAPPAAAMMGESTVRQSP